MQGISDVRIALLTRTEMELAIAACVGWYNRHRIHQPLGDAPRQSLPDILPVCQPQYCRVPGQAW